MYNSINRNININKNVTPNVEYTSNIKTITKRQKFLPKYLT